MKTKRFDVIKDTYPGKEGNSKGERYEEKTKR